MKISPLLLRPTKAVLKHTQSRRCATIRRPADGAKRLDCGGSPPLFYRAVVVGLILFLALGAPAQTTNALTDKEIQGRQLSQKLLEMRPTENFTNTGVLQIRDGTGNRTNYPVKFVITVEATNWTCLYDATPISKPGYPTFGYALLITHYGSLSNSYLCFADDTWATISNSETMFPFRHSDFWLCDLGLEFLHWPDQKVLRGDTASGRLCQILESTNPDPSPNGYSRVDSWVDNETLGILLARAYDAKGKLLKEFYPKDIKKVNGQWQVGSMTIDNVQTGSRSRLVFDLNKK